MTSDAANHPTKAGHTTKAGLPCPVCGVELVMAERQGIEIDYCPKCRGVWLDRGELDKIVDRSFGTLAGEAAPPQAAASAYQPGPAGSASGAPRDDRTSPWRDPAATGGGDYRDSAGYRERWRGDDDEDEDRGGRPRRRGFLAEIFDFD